MVDHKKKGHRMQRALSGRIKIKYIFLSISGLFVIVGITIVALNFFLPKKTTPLVVTYTNVVPLPADLLKSYKDSAATSTKNGGYIQQTDQYISPTMLYTPNGSSYALRISPQNFIAYGRTDKKDIENSQGLIQQANQFLEQKGLKKSKSVQLVGVSSTLFDSSNVVCQINAYNGSTAVVASFNIGCETHQAITMSVTAIDALLTLYKKAHTLPSPTNIQRTYITQDKKELTKLYINSTNDTPHSLTLYFAAIDKQVEYIGQKITPSVDSQNNPAPSDELKAALLDKKYGDFLTKNI